MTKLKAAKFSVELCSGFGYPACWFAKALTSGKVVLIDYFEGSWREYERTDGGKQSCKISLSS